MTIAAGTKFIGIDPDVDTTQKRSGQINDESAAYTIEEIRDTIAPYKVYTAILNQSGTNPPTVVVLQNTFDEEVVWSYEAVGEYRATNPAFTTSACVFFGANHSVALVTAAEAENGYLDIIPAAADLTIANGLLDDCPIEIRVYNS